MWENDLSGQTYLYRIICRHSQILANTPNIMGTLRSAECPRNIERISSSKFFSLGMVYSKPLGGKSRIVKLVREMKKKIGSFTWAVLYRLIDANWIVCLFFDFNWKLFVCFSNECLINLIIFFLLFVYQLVNGSHVAHILAENWVSQTH